MLFPNALFEVEFRCQFKNEAEAYQFLPFLKESLTRKYVWVDTYYGLEIFQSGQVLRASSVEHNGITRYYLGWKGQDTGTFANIRRELNEEITHGSSESAIMEWLTGTKRGYGLPEIVPAIERSGRQRFMSYQGHNLAGRYEPFGVNVKLMHCAELRWPLLVEIEKMARDAAEAQECEGELMGISRRFKLTDHIVKEEPGTLLYEVTFEDKE